MTENPQPGERLDHHLDPDQLNALASNALPAHERASTLAHLADCAHCRQILFLTQQSEIDSEPTPQPAPAKPTWRQWFTPTTFFGAATAALVATLLIAITLHLHTSKATDQQAVLKPQPNPITAQTPQPAAQAAPPAQLGIPPTAAKPLPAPTMTAAAPPPAKIPAPIQSGAIMGGMAGMPAGRGMAVQKDAPAGQIHGAAGGFGAAPTPGQPPIIAGTGAPASNINLGSAAAPAPRPAPRATASGPLQTNQSQLSQMNNYLQQTQPNAAPQNGINPTPLSQLPVESRNTQQLATNQTVEVSAAAANLDVTNATVTTMVASPTLAKRKALATQIPPATPLPSKLPATSTVTALNHTLAIDSAGALFLSTDAGRHWTSIHPQWQGKAQTLSLTAATNLRYAAAKKSPTPTDKREVTPDNNASATIITGAALDALASDAAAAAPAPTLPTQPTFQLTTDTGTTWLSNDGLIWYRR